MQLSEKLSLLRIKNGMSQEELAEKLGISRQSISKWESGKSVPDLKKLIILSDLYDVTIDSLVKDSSEDDFLESKSNKSSEANLSNDCDNKSTQVILNFNRTLFEYEYESKRTLFGLPLVHINLGKGLKKSKGIISIGNISYGFLSVGFISFGILSFGAIAFGAFSLAVISIALLLAIGVLSIGTFSIGAISIGIFSCGALAIGKYSVGACSIALDIAIGDYARGHIAIGNKVEGINKLPLNTQIEDIKFLIKQEYPKLSDLTEKIINFFINFAIFATR